jgi:hypothetical protein
MSLHTDLTLDLLTGSNLPIVATTTVEESNDLKEQRKLKRKENQKIKKEKKKEQKERDDKYNDYMKSKFDKDIAYNELLIKNMQGEISSLQSHSKHSNKHSIKIQKLNSIITSTKQDILFLKSEKLRYDFDFKQRNSIQTELCSKTLKGKPCNFEGCWYAHSSDEIRKPKCIYNMFNCCSKGTHCVYDHSDSPLPEFPKRIIAKPEDTIIKNTYCEHLYSSLLSIISTINNSSDNSDNTIIVGKIIGMLNELPIDEIKVLHDDIYIFYNKCIEAIGVILSDHNQSNDNSINKKLLITLTDHLLEKINSNTFLSSLQSEDDITSEFNSSFEVCDTIKENIFFTSSTREYMTSPELPSESSYQYNDVTTKRDYLVTPEVPSEYIYLHEILIHK